MCPPELPALMTMSLSRAIAREDQGTYIELPFPVAEEADELTVRVEVRATPPDGATIDLGVRDPQRLRGWSGGARAEFTLGQDTATPGYLPGPLPAGAWALVLGAYRVPKEGCVVVAHISVRLRSERWLAGDLHVHTLHSDGAYSVDETLRRAGELGLDFVALTDHNTTSQNRAVPAESGVVAIPAMELTTYHGHCTLYGVADLSLDWRARDPAELAAVLAAARGQGARIALAHPFEDMCAGCAWEWGWDVPFDWLEVWNGPWRPANGLALEHWVRLLDTGRRIPAIGGSDTHGPHLLVRHGLPTTWVAATSRSVAGVLEAINLGRVCVSVGPEGPRAVIRADDAGMGGVARAGTSVRMLADGLHEGDILRLYSRDGLLGEAMASGPHGILEALPSERANYVRGEVWRAFPEYGLTLPAALSNPVYLAGE